MMISEKKYVLVMNGYEEGRFIDLDSGIHQLGRSEDMENEGRRNDIVLAYDDKISRVHAIIENNGERLTIRDAGSTYGVQVNQTKITGTKILVKGDVITVGETLLLICGEEKTTSLFGVLEAKL